MFGRFAVQDNPPMYKEVYNTDHDNSQIVSTWMHTVIWLLVHLISVL